MKKTYEAVSLKLAIDAAPTDCTVIVGAKYAAYFKTAPKDGRTYVVEDPNHKHVFHWTYPDGTYERVEKKSLLNKYPQLVRPVAEKRIQGKPRRKKKRARIASDIGRESTLLIQSN